MDSFNPDFERDFLVYSVMVAEIEKHGIKFLGVNGHTVEFEKDGKTLNHALMTWQCAPDPERPAITPKSVVEMVVSAFEKPKNKE